MTTQPDLSAPAHDAGADGLPWWRRGLAQGAGYFLPSGAFVLVPFLFSEGWTPRTWALAILAAAGPDGGAVVTCITDDPHHLDAAKSAVRSAGHPASAARYIAARPLDVADKLADGAYDLVVADVPAHSLTRVVSRSQQLLRAGGALVLLGEHAPLPEEAELPKHAHVTVLPVGNGLTIVTL